MSVSDLDKLARRPDTVVCSVKKGWNLEFLSDRIWDYLSLTRIYTKKKGGAVDLSEPVILRPKYGRKPTIQSVCEHIHRDMVKKFKYARVWGKRYKLPNFLKRLIALSFPVKGEIPNHL